MRSETASKGSETLRRYDWTGKSETSETYRASEWRSQGLGIHLSLDGATPLYRTLSPMLAGVTKKLPHNYANFMTPAPHRT